jgi:hypothetical protein
VGFASINSLQRRWQSLRESRWPSATGSRHSVRSECRPTILVQWQHRASGMRSHFVVRFQNGAGSSLDSGDSHRVFMSVCLSSVSR